MQFQKWSKFDERLRIQTFILFAIKCTTSETRNVNNFDVHVVSKGLPKGRFWTYSLLTHLLTIIPHQSPMSQFCPLLLQKKPAVSASYPSPFISILSLEEKAVMQRLGRISVQNPSIYEATPCSCSASGRVPCSQHSCRDAGSTRRWMKGLTENDWVWQGKDKLQTEGIKSRTESKAGETSFSGLKEQPQSGGTDTS